MAARGEPPWPHLWLLDRYPGGGRLAWDEWPLRLLRLLPRRCLTRLLSAAAVPAFQRNPHVLRPLQLPSDRLLIANVDVITSGLASDRLTVRDAAFASFLRPGEAELTDGSSIAAELCIFGGALRPPLAFLREAPSCLHRGVLAVSPEAWGLAFLHEPPVAELEARWLAHHWARGRFAADSDRAALARRERPEPAAADAVTRKLREAARMEALAADIACGPALWRLLLSPRPARRRAGVAVLAGPWLPQQFRLDDAGAARVLVRVARDVGGWRFLALLDCYELVFHTAAGLLLHWAMCRLLRRS